MFHITSSLFGGLAGIAAWALVAQPFDTASANIGAEHEHANRVVKADRIAAPRTNIGNVTVISKGYVLPQVTVREMPIPVGCDPVASPIVEPALARVIGRCLS